MAKEPLFYSLPFEQISKIIKKVEFSNEDEVNDPLILLQTLIEKTSEVYEKEAVLLLNDIKVSNLPQPTLEDIIGIVSKFTKSEILTKLGELYKEEKSLPKLDYEYINKKYEEINKRYQELKSKITNKFFHVTEKPSDYEVDIFKACEKGKLDNVQYHFEILHSDKEATCERAFPGENQPTKGLTALHISAAYGQLDIVKYLCEIQKVNTEAKDEYIRTPFYITCKNGQLDVVKYLFEIAKVNPETKDKDGSTPLHFASQKGHLDVVKYLFEIAKVNSEATEVFQLSAKL